MPRLLILADLHLDKWQADGRDPLATMPSGWFDQFDMIILAGDLTDKPKVRLAGVLAELGRYVPFDRLQIFPGNHCYYHHVLDGDARLEAIATNAGAGFAQCRSLSVGDTRVLCCTLWTDMKHPTVPPDILSSETARRMNDYRYIRVAASGYRKARPSDTVALHRQHLEWLHAQLTKPHAGSTIVVTHHAPILAGLDDDLRHAYGSDLTAFIRETAPDAWFYGHSHIPFSTSVGRTEVKNVSLGYPFDLEDDDMRRRFEAAVVDIQ